MDQILYQWAARDDDDWCWLFAGEPELDRGTWDMQTNFHDLSGHIARLACTDVPKNHKRKVKSLDIAKGTVEYEGEAIHGGGQ